MRPNALLLTIAALTATTLGAPAPEAVSMKASVQDWTIESLVRHCNPQNSYCEWNFRINTHLEKATPCTFGVRGGSQGATSGVVCGAFTVSSGWSGQFVEGFTTLSVVDHKKRLIAWPAYTDGQLVNDRVVVPDRSWPVSELK